MIYTQKIIEIELIATNLKDIVAECLGGCIVVVVRLEGHYRRAPARLVWSKIMRDVQLDHKRVRLRTLTKASLVKYPEITRTLLSFQNSIVDRRRSSY